MLVKTKAIILRNTNYSESSVISRMYTREYGIRTYMLNGVRKGKGSIRPSMIQPISLVHLDAYEKPNAGIQRIKELKNRPLLVNIQSDMLKKTVALFLIETINYSIQEEACEPELFDLLEQHILKVEEEEVAPDYPIRFLLELSTHLGFAPQGRSTVHTPYFDLANGQFVSTMGELTVSEKESEALSRFWLEQCDTLAPSGLRKACLQLLLKYYQIHLHKNSGIRSVDILSELLN